MAASSCGVQITCGRDELASRHSIDLAKGQLGRGVYVYIDRSRQCSRQFRDELAPGTWFDAPGETGGNLKGVEGVATVIGCLHSALSASGADYAVKFDADTLLFPHSDRPTFMSVVDCGKYAAIGFKRLCDEGFSGACYAIHRSALSLLGSPVSKAFDLEHTKRYLRLLSFSHFGGRLLDGGAPEDKVISNVVLRALGNSGLVNLLPPDGDVGFRRSNYRRPDWRSAAVVEYGQRHLLRGSHKSKQDQIVMKMQSDIYAANNAKS